MSIENPYLYPSAKKEIEERDRIEILNGLEEKENRSTITENKEVINIEETEKKLDNIDKEKEETIYGFSKEELEQLFGHFGLEKIFDYLGGPEIDQEKEKNIKEVLEYLVKEVFPYFKVTLEDEENYKKLIEENDRMDPNLKKINIQSFQNVRIKLLEFFLEASVEGLFTQEGREFIKIIDSLSRVRVFSASIINFMQLKSVNDLNLEKIRNKVINFSLDNRENEDLEKIFAQIKEQTKELVGENLENDPLYKELSNLFIYLYKLKSLIQEKLKEVEKRMELSKERLKEEWRLDKDEDFDLMQHYISLIHYIDLALDIIREKFHLILENHRLASSLEIFKKKGNELMEGDLRNDLDYIKNYEGIDWDAFKAAVCADKLSLLWEILIAIERQVISKINHLGLLEDNITDFDSEQFAEQVYLCLIDIKNTLNDERSQLFDEKRGSLKNIIENITLFRKKLDKVKVLEMLKSHSNMVKKDQIFCTHRGLTGFKGILHLGYIASTVELEYLQDKGMLPKEISLGTNLKGGTTYFGQSQQLGFKRTTPLIYGFLIGGKQFTEWNEFLEGGSGNIGFKIGYGPFLFMSSIDKFKERAFCTLGSLADESKSIYDRFSLDHAYIIKGIINFKRSTRKLFDFKRIEDPKEMYIGMEVIGRIMPDEIDQIIISLKGLPPEKKNKIIETLNKLKIKDPEVIDNINDQVNINDIINKIKIIDDSNQLHG